MESIDIWFNSWGRLESVAIGTIYFYVFVVATSRLLGKRLTGQMNNFDWIVTVAIGSLMASGILLKGVSIVDSTLAILMLSGMQWLTTRLVVESDTFEAMVKPAPTLLTHKGQFLRENMRKERISESEIRARLRRMGYFSLEDANWVVLETNGQLAVIPKSDRILSEVELMADVDGSEKAK